MNQDYQFVRLLRTILVAFGWLAAGLGLVCTLGALFTGAGEWILVWAGVFLSGACSLGASEVLTLLLRLALEVTEVRGMLMLGHAQPPRQEPETADASE